jgi:hypothetical protein
MTTRTTRIFTKRDIAARYSMQLSTVNTLCSRSPSSLPPFFKMGGSANSPIRFREEDCDIWDNERVKTEQARRSSKLESVDLTTLINIK